ncbi:hypothetical protein HK405_004353 [Cladochytrium tenue]|nr:hypothetical protein HK405_004353 [Cladochytrium tenue]
MPAPPRRIAQAVPSVPVDKRPPAPNAASTAPRRPPSPPPNLRDPHLLLMPASYPSLEAKQAPALFVEDLVLMTYDDGLHREFHVDVLKAHAVSVRRHVRRIAIRFALVPWAEQPSSLQGPGFLGASPSSGALFPGAGSPTAPSIFYAVSCHHNRLPLRPNPMSIETPSTSAVHATVVIPTDLADGLNSFEIAVTAFCRSASGAVAAAAAAGMMAPFPVGGPAASTSIDDLVPIDGARQKFFVFVQRFN